MEHNISLRIDDILLVPMTEEGAIRYAALRSSDKSRNQFFYSGVISPEEQKKWYEGYQKSSDEIMFDIYIYILYSGLHWQRWPI